MSRMRDDGVPRDARGHSGPRESLTLEQLIGIVSFPVHGFIDGPNDLTLQTFGYTVIDDQTGEFGIGGPPFVWQVGLHYGRLPGHQHTEMRVEVFTNDINYSPILAAKVDKIGQVPKTHYRSQRDVPLLTEAAGSIVIEHFMLPQGPVEATVLYKSQTPMRGRLLGTQAHEALPSSSPHPSGVPGRPVESPAWSFTLRAPEMWVEGNVYGGTQSEMFDVLAQIDAISGRPALLARYQKELSAWEHLSGR